MFKLSFLLTNGTAQDYTFWRRVKWDFVPTRDVAISITDGYPALGVKFITIAAPGHVGDIELDAMMLKGDLDEARQAILAAGWTDVPDSPRKDMGGVASLYVSDSGN